jgi:subtilisin family serine protease
MIGDTPKRPDAAPTGGLIVMFRDGVDHARQERCMAHCVGAAAHTLSIASETPGALGADMPGVLLGNSGIGYVAETAETTVARERLEADDAVEAVRPEYWMYALAPFEDTDAATWGLQAIGADTSPRAGAGARLCILDTGLDLDHPDFAGRQVQARSFVAGETVADVNGHGTHCAGTAAGRVATPGIRRYGVAPGADLYVGKVLGDNGAGRERDILAGMLWAIDAGCAVISMSLGRAVAPDELPSPDYERIGRLALGRGTLIVAAAGNDSARSEGRIAPVGAPANSLSILAVAALDPMLAVADFSSGGINPAGGAVDLAAPGVGIFSSVPRPENYRVLRGTSMACPHVAGVAALWAGTDAALRGQRLWDAMTANAATLGAPERDVGRGLVRAPGAAMVS